MDGRRHSVDVPISKTLVALRRVRSLRDPSTNSMSKFSSVVDSLHWDTNSCNGISLRFGNGCQEGVSSNNGWDLSKILGTCGEEDENVKEIESKECTPKSHSKLVISKSVGKSGSKVVGTKSKCDDSRENGLDLACISPSNDQLEDVDSNNGSTVRSSTPMGGKVHSSTRNHSYGCKRSVGGSVGDFVSRAGSPSLCASDTFLEGSTRSASLFGNDEIDALDREYRGCGITCCWSRTPRYRDPCLASDNEEYPLMSGETGDTEMSGRSRSWKQINNEIVPYAESPRSLSIKFRPKSFDELVGQGVAARSLLGAISKGITSFYLFHGPRGAGKTSASRIFAAALNCLSLEEQRPCGSCQECMLYFAGRSRDVKELDPVRINRAGRLSSLIKTAALPPISSRFKVFILDECHLLRGDTWATLLTNLDSFSRHVVFVMITPDPDKLPRSVVARSQRYHFPKLKDVDVANRLGKICVEEGLEFDEAALEFIASKSNGSMRDAEMMLDQLSLLGSKITTTSAYELVSSIKSLFSFYCLVVLCSDQF